MTVETGFTTQGYDTFPSLYSDTKRVIEVVEWPQQMLDDKINEYGEFITRKDLMPRAKKTADWILDRLLFEAACRDGIYDKENDNE